MVFSLATRTIFMAHVIITGGTGFVGANLARRLLHDGHEVNLLVRLGFTSWRINDMGSDLRLHTVDMGDRDALIRIVGKIRPDWIFHLAAHGGTASQNDCRQMVETNIVGTINLVEACLNVGFQAFVNTGSSSEYGFKHNAPSETEWLEPNSHYAVTKASASLFCRYTAQSQDAHMPTLRLYSVYGALESPNRLLPTLITLGLKGKLPPLVSPETAHDFVYIEDVIDAYLLAAKTSGQESGAIYNVGTGVQTALREVVEVAQRALGISVEPVWGSMPSRRWDTDKWVADNRKIEKALGWRPQHTFEEGFRQMVNWYKSRERGSVFLQSDK